MPFSDFAGNSETIHRLREMLARDRFPHAVIISGAHGSGKYTLALMLARTMNCLERPSTDGLPDFCGHCSNCTRIAQSEDLDSRFSEAVEARENLRDTDKKETRIFVQTHPDVLIIPPDPPQLMIKVDQVRHVIETIYYRPGEARERVYIFTSSAFMKEAANSLLKVLEEPPEFASIFLLAENPGELLPTIRSRSMIFNLGALAVTEIESRLAQLRPEWNVRQRALVSRLSEGAIGRALSFDLRSSIWARSLSRRSRAGSPSFVPSGMSGSARWFPASAKAPSDAPYPSISDLQSGRARCHGDREPARPASSRVECPAARAGFPPQRRRHRTRLILRS